MALSSDSYGFRFIPKSAVEDLVPAGPGVAVARIPSKIRLKSQLLRILAQQLKFPEYFGHNYDALEECLRDFSWLPGVTKIAVVHTDLPVSQSRGPRAMYLSILAETVAYWNSHSEIQFEVYFPERVRGEIARTLADSA